MTSLASHISAFLFLFPVGLCRISSTTTLLLQYPATSSYKARPWYFSTHTNPHLRLLCNADFYALLLFLPVAAFSYILLFLTLDHLPFILCAAVSSLFFLLLLVHCIAPRSLVPDDVVFFLAALAFLADYGLSTVPYTEIAARTCRYSSFLTIACSVACMIMAVRQSLVAADYALGIGLALKGTWALQEGLTLYAMPPRGCLVSKDDWGELLCELEEDMGRGTALVELMFAGHAVAVAICSVVTFWVTARRERRAANFTTIITRPVTSYEQ